MADLTGMVASRPGSKKCSKTGSSSTVKHTQLNAQCNASVTESSTIDQLTKLNPTCLPLTINAPRRDLFPTVDSK
jgi:hypothetical protein